MNLTLVLHNIRSAYNVGAILRTAECFGVEKVIFSGYTPHLEKGLPHERIKLATAIHKTALGAEDMVDSEYTPDVFATLDSYRSAGYAILALEQAPTAIPLDELPDELPENIIMILGEEIHGIPRQLLKICDAILEIPQKGKKESLNVSVAASIAIWGLTNHSS